MNVIGGSAQIRDACFGAAGRAVDSECEYKSCSSRSKGRPRVFEEDTVVIAFKMTVRHREAIDETARRFGMCRSEYLRKIVEDAIGESR